jgi:hypothetical protein
VKAPRFAEHCHQFNVLVKQAPTLNPRDHYRDVLMIAVNQGAPS